jgi:four helix bundle protein
MFDFEKLDIYYRAKQFYAETKNFCKNSKVDSTSKGQLIRASFSIILNIAEGSGRFSKADRRNFFVIARSSIFECVAIFDVLKDEGVLSEQQFRKFYEEAEELSKILFALIKGLSK